MICGSNQGIYGKLVEEFQNYFTEVNKYYPANTTEVYNLLVNYKTSYNPPAGLVYDSEKVLFANFRSSKGVLNHTRAVEEADRGRCDATDVESSDTSPDNVRTKRKKKAIM